MELWQFLLTLLCGGGVGGGGVFGWWSMRDKWKAEANVKQGEADLIQADVRRKDAETHDAETDTTIRRLKEYISLMDAEHAGDRAAHVKLHDDWLATREELSAERAHAANLEREVKQKDEELNKKQTRIDALEKRTISLEKKVLEGGCKWSEKSA